MTVIFDLNVCKGLCLIATTFLCIFFLFFISIPLFCERSHLLVAMTMLCNPCNKNKSKFGVGIIKNDRKCNIVKLISWKKERQTDRRNKRKREKVNDPAATVLFGEIFIALFHFIHNHKCFDTQSYPNDCCSSFFIDWNF